MGVDEPMKFICYRQVSVFANVKIKIEMISIIDGLSSLFGPIVRDETVLAYKQEKRSDIYN